MELKRTALNEVELALLQLGPGVSPAFKKRLASLIKEPVETPPTALYFSPEARKAFATAESYRKNHRHTHIETQGLIIALLQHEGDLVARAVAAVPQEA